MVTGILKKIGLYILLIMIWELAYRLGLNPSPSEVSKKLIDFLGETSFFIGLATSMRRLILGYVISIGIGSTIGLILYRFKFLDENLKSIILGLQSLPSVGWIPFALLWFGQGERAILFVLVMGSTFAIAIAIEGALRNANPLYIKAARTMGSSGFSLFKNVIIPGSLPEIITGLKQGWTFAWRSLIAGEMIGSDIGLGYLLMMGRDQSDIASVVAIMIVIIAIGLILDKFVFTRLEYILRKRWGLI